ncbi:unnamed protein product [Blumeria hordei]|uniref:RRM domain-containing protein n=2 Tax=Blumeria hordei TaxID=2867405 RepID=A0A383V408_BLUHO|nr:putative ribosomal processing RNA binding nucleolar protein [Blumeria hordei DH14]SZF06370.1 unnamed protein product [Blumeria hordei]
MQKRQRLSEDEENIDTSTDNKNNNSIKKPRNETNALAQRTLFVRALPALATSEALTNFFSQNYPLKHATVVLDTETKQSKGYGFVTFADAHDAQKAQEELNGTVFMGRKIKIEVAEPRSRVVTKADAQDGRAKSKISEKAAAIKKARMEEMAISKAPPKLIIRNLPWSIKSPDQLADLFKKYGKVKFATLPKIKDNTQAGFGFVTMRGKKNAEKAMACLNGTSIDGRTVAVDRAVDKSLWEGLNKNPSEDNTSIIEKQIDKAPSCNTSKACAEDNNRCSSTATANQEELDVMNFLNKFGDQIESETEDDMADEPKDHSNDSTKLSTLNEDDLTWEDDLDETDGLEENNETDNPIKTFITDNSSTLFVRNLPFTTLDAELKEHFEQFGPVRYARVVMERTTGRSKGSGFVCYYNVEDADSCYRGAPRNQPTGANALSIKHSILENEASDVNGMYTIEGRVLQISRAVERDDAQKLTEAGTSFRIDRDKDKRKLYLLNEGTVASGTPLYETLSPSEIKMREDSAKQRKKLIQNNPMLHLSLTRLSVRNLPRQITSKDLKALAREAVVGFAKDVKSGIRSQLSKEEESRGGEEDRVAEQLRKSKGKGIVRQAKIVYEGREGKKISEDSGAGRSRGYGFIEYHSHRWALMGLRWLNGHVVKNSSGKSQRLIVEFAIENVQVVQRRKASEEKARTRSMDVLKARERGEMPEKKKVLGKDQIMAKTRKGKKGENETYAKSFTKLIVKPEKVHDKKNPEMDKSADGRNLKTSKKPASNNDNEQRLAKKSQIIQRKRQMRKAKGRGKHA